MTAPGNGPRPSPSRRSTAGEPRAEDPTVQAVILLTEQNGILRYLANRCNELCALQRETNELIRGGRLPASDRAAPT